jgi:hypothetical protein
MDEITELDQQDKQVSCAPIIYELRLSPIDSQPDAEASTGVQSKG